MRSLGEEVARPDLAAGFQGIREQFTGPWEIDEAPETVPSKRVG